MRLAILLILLACAGQVAAEEAGDAASALVSSQSADGSWGGTEKGAESQIYTAAKVLNGLMHYGGEPDSVDKGIEWIELQGPADTASLSEVASVLHSAGKSPGSEIARLAEYQNADGGWGKTMGFESTPWYTSSAIIALNPFDDRMDAIIDGGEYLLREQGADGDFEDSAFITSDCIYALVLLYNSTGNADFALAAIQGYEWLNKTANEEGAWVDAVSTSSSVIALDALYGLTGDGAMDATSAKAKSWIINSSGNETDPLSTAWVLMALSQETAISPAEPKTSISASLTKDYVFPPDTTEIKFKIENSGFADMKNISLLLATPKELRAEIGRARWDIGALHRNSSVELSEGISIPADTEEGEYPIMMAGGSISSTVTLHVLESPLVFEVSPTELKNDAPLDFKLSIKNRGVKGISIQSVALDLGESWKDVRLNDVQLDLLPGSEKSAALFSAKSPAERGEYRGTLTIDFVHPDIGSRQITVDQKFLVSGAVPPGILKLVLYGTLVLSMILLLNLLLGYDLMG